MADRNDLGALRAKKDRLVALLESHGMEWRARQQPSPPPIEPSRLSTDAKVALFRRLFRRKTSEPLSGVASAQRCSDAQNATLNAIDPYEWLRRCSSNSRVSQTLISDSRTGRPATRHWPLMPTAACPTSGRRFTL